MPFALELLLDLHTTTAVQTAISALHRIRPPSTWRGYPDLPHLSLLVADFIDPEKAIAACRLTPAVSPESVQLGPTQEFLVPSYVLYLKVSEVPWLRSLQRRLYWNLLSSAQGIWHHYTPEAWVPHVTLSQGALVSRKRIREIDEHYPLFPVAFTEFVLVEFDSAHRRELVRIALPKLSQDAIAQQDATWQRFVVQLTQGEYFEAHETIEELWRVNHDPRLQSAIWVAAAFVHWSRGTRTGAQKLFGKLVRDEGHRPDPLIPQIRVWTEALSQNLPCPGIAPTDRDALVKWARYRD